MKTLLYLAAILILASCNPCTECNQQLEQSKVNLHISDSLLTQKQKEVDSLTHLISGGNQIQARTTSAEAKTLCNAPQHFTVSAYTFSYNITTFRFEAKPNVGGTTCEIPVPVSPNYIKLTITAGDLYFENINPTGLNLTASVTNIGVGDPADIDIVKNNYKHPDATWPTDVLKIIGADDGRNINNATPPGGQMAYANIEESPVYVTRNNLGTSYTFKQANGSSLGRANHTMLLATGYQAKKEKEDKE